MRLIVITIAILSLVALLWAGLARTSTADAASNRQVVYEVCGLQSWLSILSNPGYGLRLTTPVPADPNPALILDQRVNPQTGCLELLTYHASFAPVPPGQNPPHVALEFQVLEPLSQIQVRQQQLLQMRVRR